MTVTPNAQDRRQMLKKIAVDQLRVGMFVHQFEGAWTDHPFWRSRFSVDSRERLEMVKASAVRTCWIDTLRGLDAAEPEPVRPAPASSGAAPSPAPQALVPVSVAAEEESRRAVGIIERGRQAVTSMFGEARLGRAVDAAQCQALVQEISESVQRNPDALVSLARLKTKDDYSYMHSVAVCALMVSLARQQGFSPDACREAGEAGLLHDIGKAVMPQTVLTKPGRLTEEEFATMKRHPERGHAILLEGRGASPAALDVCLHHHEKVDGSGYPYGLTGDRMTLLSRMGAVCDVYDAITSNRPYKSGWDPGESLARMASWKGHFDTDVFHAFVRCVGIYPTGTLVRMASGRLAVVTAQNAADPTAPVVKVFFSIKSNMHIPPMRLDLAAAQTADHIVGRESPATWGFKHLDELWIEPGIRPPRPA
jgi:HD-GYP domain-containing protein (c-di-GMP phosphodiesterase class II)